jgi:phage/plasmid primase-like uncharacterized protein
VKPLAGASGLRKGTRPCPIRPQRATYRRRGRELIGPCPVCGGTDRFGVNVLKSVWNCRGCNQGGDVIELVRHLDNCGFLTAIETLTGEVRPDNTPGQLPDPESERQLAKQRERNARELRRRTEQERQDAARQLQLAEQTWQDASPTRLAIKLGARIAAASKGLFTAGNCANLA